MHMSPELHGDVRHRTGVTVRSSSGRILHHTLVARPHEYSVADLEREVRDRMGLLQRDDMRLVKDGRQLERHEHLPANTDGTDHLELTAVFSDVKPCHSPLCETGSLPRCPMCGRRRSHQGLPGIAAAGNGVCAGNGVAAGSGGFPGGPVAGNGGLSGNSTGGSGPPSEIGRDERSQLEKVAEPNPEFEQAPEVDMTGRPQQSRRLQKGLRNAKLTPHNSKLVDNHDSVNWRSGASSSQNSYAAGYGPR